MLLPLKDHNPIRRIPFQYVTVGLIAACVLAFLGQLWQPDGGERLVYGLGTVPAVLLGEARLPAGIELVAPQLTLVTAMFLHGGWMHLIGNMAFLWIFGDNVEDAMGHVRFLCFYLLCGIIAGLVHVGMNPASAIPAIGASGAISGVLGAYLVLHPKARVLTLFLRFLVPLPAVVVLGAWIAFQFLSAYLPGDSGTGGGVAWWAHIGGFIAGALLVIPFRQRGVPLLDGIGRRG
jgi:membrane associated rhomboid family serine protease